MLSALREVTDPMRMALPEALWAVLPASLNGGFVEGAEMTGNAVGRVG